MANRVLLLINRILDDTGEAVRTPSGVNVDLLRAYGRHDKGALPTTTATRSPRGATASACGHGSRRRPNGRAKDGSPLSERSREGGGASAPPPSLSFLR